jgi:hypothetical protein
MDHFKVKILINYSDFHVKKVGPDSDPEYFPDPTWPKKSF